MTCDSPPLFVAANIPEVQDFWWLSEDSHVAALLIPYLVASALAPTTRYTYSLHYAKFARRCDSNNRRAMPLSMETISIYFAMLALLHRTPTDVLAARSAVKFLYSLAYPDWESPTNSNRISQILQGICRKFDGIVNRRITLTPDQMKEIL